MHLRSPSPRSERERSRSRSPDAKRTYRPKERSRSPRGSDEDVNPGNNLFVSGLSIKTKDVDLEEEFAKFGKVVKCNIMYDPHTKDSRGFGFICFEKVEEAEAAIAALNGYELHGRRITVEKAKRGKARPPTPGSYFGPTRARPPRDVMLPPWFYPDPRFPDRFDPRYDMREMFRTPRDFRGPSLYPPVERGYYGRSSYDRAYPERYESRREDRDRDRRRYDDPRDSRDSYRSRGY